MHLMYYLNEKGERVYTLNKSDPSGKPTFSAHPARFSPDDKHSKYRVVLKKRFGILLTQRPKEEMWDEERLALYNSWFFWLLILSLNTICFKSRTKYKHIFPVALVVHVVISDLNQSKGFQESSPLANTWYDDSQYKDYHHGNLDFTS